MQKTKLKREILSTEAFDTIVSIMQDEVAMARDVSTVTLKDYNEFESEWRALEFYNKKCIEELKDLTKVWQLSNGNILIQAFEENDSVIDEYFNLVAENCRGLTLNNK